MTGERFIANCFKPRKSVFIRRPRSPQRGADTKVSGTSIAYELPFRKSFDVSLEMIIAECQMTYIGAPWGRSKNIASLPTFYDIVVDFWVIVAIWHLNCPSQNQRALPR